jgi:ADP-L-glycero-D-manno-heptose 6-epimerase
MIIVTGGAGFIGSNLVSGLNQQYPKTPILVVDNLTVGNKIHNLTVCRIHDYLDKQEFLAQIKRGIEFPNLHAVFHQGACSDTTESNGRYLMENNYQYSKELLHYCIDRKIPFIYASSAAVYGRAKSFHEDQQLRPLNPYAYSKLLFDQYVGRLDVSSQIVGLRYFNVYGPGEAHKGHQSSVIWKWLNRLRDFETLELFEGSDGYAAGEQIRDFIYVDDVVAINLWFLKHRYSGIFNVGTGCGVSFNAVANVVIDLYKRGRIEYIPFPKSLENCYQSFTQSNFEKLRQLGYDHAFVDISEGVRKYFSLFQIKK